MRVRESQLERKKRIEKKRIHFVHPHYGGEFEAELLIGWEARSKSKQITAAFSIEVISSRGSTKRTFNGETL